jgi:acyl-CoA thioesterase
VTEEIRLRAHELFDGTSMMQHLEVELTEVGDEWAEMCFVVNEKHGNYIGSLHGGAVAAVMDTVAFFPGALIPSGRPLTTEGLEVHYFRPVQMGERVRLRSRILRNGRRVVTVEVKALGEDDRQIAHGIATLLDVKAG